MKQSLDIEEIKEKLLIKLEVSGWARVLKGFIESKDFDNTIFALAKQAQDGKRFTPTLKNLFRAFEECPYDKLKVIIVSPDPYPGFKEADGIAFSLKNTNDMLPSLNYIFKAINKTVYNDVEICTNKDLTRWSNQGMLLLNTSMTTTISKIGQHHLIWRPFIAYLFDWLSWHCPGMVYIYMGKKAEEWSDTVNDNNYKFTVTNPIAATYGNQEHWDSQDVFVKTKEIIKKTYNIDIEW
jgi:uracil-DNA glycosylase